MNHPLEDTAVVEARLTRPGSPYEIQPFNTEFGTERCFKHASGSLKDLVRKSRNRGNSPLLVTSTRSFSYGEIFEHASTLAGYLRRHDIKSGARVGIVVTGGPAWIISFLGTLYGNAIPVVVDVSRPEHLIHMLDLIGPSFIITDGAHQQFINSSYECCLVERIISKEGASSLDESEIDCEPRDNVALGLISFTSGSTNKPKPVFCSDRAILTGLMNMLLAGSVANSHLQRPPPNNRIAPCSLIASPLAHVSGYVQLLLAMMVGGRLAMNLDGRSLTSFIRENCVTALSALDTDSTFELLATPNVERELQSLRTWNISGLPLRKSVAGAITEKLPHVTLMTGYGLTETCGGVSAIAGGQLVADLRSSGRLVPTAEIRIVSDAGEELRNGEAGQIWLRGPMLMSGYVLKDGIFSGLEKGWFQTGDIGFLSTDRQLYVLDRNNDVIQLGSGQISSGEVECYVTEMEGVHDACLVGFSNCGSEQLGLAIAAVNMTSERLSAIKDGVAERFEISGSDISILPVKELPRTASGKVVRAKLRDFFEAVKSARS
jgi:long-chain acyl-CoA synthetase